MRFAEQVEFSSASPESYTDAPAPTPTSHARSQSQPSRREAVIEDDSTLPNFQSSAAEDTTGLQSVFDLTGVEIDESPRLVLPTPSPFTAALNAGFDSNEMTFASPWGFSNGVISQRSIETNLC